MNGFDDLFVKDNEGKDSNQRQFDEKEFDKDAWAEKKKQERADAYALIDDGTETIMQDSEVFRDFLNVQARFDRYSVSNAILIAHQMPEATRLADFDGWKNHDYTIKKGETAITILEPGNEYTKEDGTKAFSVNVKKVFDITQTVDGKAVNSKYPEQRKAIKALISSAPCDIVMDSEKAGEKLAVYSPDADVIYIRQGMDGNDIFRSLAQEISVARFAAKDVDRKDCAFYAYCSAYILCERNGFDTGDFNFDRVPERFKKMDFKAVRNELSAIRDSANNISHDMTRQFEAMEKANRKRDDAVR